MAADIFKLLSRSTKLSKSTGQPQVPSQKFPSSGEPAHPQIFGHSTSEDTTLATETAYNPPKIGRKRKRGQAAPVEDELPAELDFFGAGGTTDNIANGRDKARLEREQDQRALKNVGTVNGDEKPQEEMDEDKRRRILREHKVKITVLEEWKIPEPLKPQERKSKKKRKHKEEEELLKAAKKKAKIQLYPQPLLSFRELRPRYNISRRLAENIEEQGYAVPTEVQMAALPLLLERDDGQTPDILSVAPTGSGKTLAFLIPVMDGIMHLRKGSSVEIQERDGEDGPLAIIVAPTKELASQIVNEGRKLAKGTGIKVTLMKKGMELIVRSQSKTNGSIRVPHDLNQNNNEEADDDSDDEGETERQSSVGTRVKSHVLVSTPLTLVHALSAAPSLPTIHYLVLDEADVLLDPLFRDQTLSIWNTCSSPHLRVSLWSATMGSNIEALTRNTIAERHSMNAETDRTPLLRLVVGLRDTALPTIHHKLIYSANEQGKLLALRQLLRPTVPSTSKDSLTSPSASLRPPFLVFTQTIPRALALAAEIQHSIPPSAGGELRVACLHADMSDTKRDDVMTRFRKGEVWVLVTTDLLARGVDFRGINGVVNYDIPTSAAGYIHRVGRTGRAGREGGVAVTLYAEEDLPFLKPIANVVAASEKARGADGGAEGVQEWLLNALPTPSKREKKMLKKRGVEARRPGMESGKGGGKVRISTKSGFERKMEHRRRDAVNARRRKEREQAGEDESGFDGFDD
ncbi:P-loop containing nucleoside triphosphate hydrolase protein [Rhizodiscina lignyota]|uniref:ATP-dependent RNA helicase n=1 Tax=Rhizodiscina lignyota TaxID=1504668 RepID=A0A9P4I7E7_9PEZI|nr:P-loop containing nucleoside triphosphate hydrolase protein [Rhizodiscina lignyota]